MATQPILNLHTWVSLPNETRQRIRHMFKIPQSGNVFVNDGRIETDGTTPEDFKVLTVERMQEYLGILETDFNKLFDFVVDKVEGREIIKEVVEKIPTPVVEIINANTTPDVKKTVEKSKQVKKGNRK